VDLVVYPELALTGYFTEDLTKNKDFLQAITAKVELICDLTKGKTTGIIISIPLLQKAKLYNAGILIEDGRISGTFNKINLPNYGVFDEQRIFQPGTEISPLVFKHAKLGCMICEDMWYDDVANQLNDQQADFFIVINASPFEIGKQEKRLELATKIAKQYKKALFYVNLFGGQDDLTFDGGSFVLNHSGQLVKKPSFWQETTEIYSLTDKQIQVIKQSEQIEYDSLNHIYHALMVGLGDYLNKNGFKKIILGLSGGIDSALVAVLASDVLGAENVRCLMLPSKYTSIESFEDAKQIAENAGINLDQISIQKIFATCLEELHASFKGKSEDATEENLQARIRCLLMMAISNKFNELLLSTSNKSESATGYTTLYGDMSGGFAPIKDLYKTQIYQLVNWRNKNIPHKSKLNKIELFPNRIITKAPTAELRHNQKDQDTIPAYDVLDKILYQIIEEDKSIREIVAAGVDEKLVERIFKMIVANEYKRRQGPIGTKINKVSFNKDRRYPVTNKFM
ncbi:NAD synthetase, partial [Reticulomyxa filosa]